jgi:hypothetical protein
MRRSLPPSLLACALVSLLGCGGGGGKSPGSVTQRIEPCEGASLPTATVAGTPSTTASPPPEPTAAPTFVPVSDVWSIDFNPADRAELAVSLDTINAADAAEFRLIVACLGSVVAQTIGGAPCTFPPPPNAPDAVPECPVAGINLANYVALARVSCLIEITPTQPLDIGSGVCANPQRAQYRLTAMVDQDRVGLTLAAHDCQAPQSCLQTYFGINVGATPTPTPTS